MKGKNGAIKLHFATTGRTLSKNNNRLAKYANFFVKKVFRYNTLNILLVEIPQR